MTATAIRYANKTDAALAVVMSTGEHIDYCFMSDSLREFSGLRYLRKGDSLQDDSATRLFNEDQSNVTQALRRVAESDLQAWFGGRRSVELKEEIVGLGGYGKTMTVLTAMSFADDEDEDEELEESWTPRFHR